MKKRGTLLSTNLFEKLSATLNIVFIFNLAIMDWVNATNDHESRSNFYRTSNFQKSNELEKEPRFEPEDLYGPGYYDVSDYKPNHSHDYPHLHQHVPKSKKDTKSKKKSKKKSKSKKSKSKKSKKSNDRQPMKTLHPSMFPTYSPTIRFDPTVLPSSDTIPTILPTKFPTPRPTSLCNMNESSRAIRIKTNLIPISGLTALNNRNSAQYEALTWLVQEDNRVICPDDQSLNQRYVLALLYYSTNGDEWLACTNNELDSPCVDANGNEGTRFLGEESECNWFGIECDLNDSVIAINIDPSFFSGPIPNEIFELPGIIETKF